MKFKMIHENYNVSDLDVSLEFYEKALGLTENRGQPMAEGGSGHRRGNTHCCAGQRSEG